MDTGVGRVRIEQAAEPDDFDHRDLRLDVIPAECDIAPARSN
jgi:hypothetical protein